MFRTFLFVLAAVVLTLAQGCATTNSGTTVVPASIDRPVSVPPGEKVMIITPGDSTLRSGAVVPMIAPADVYRHVENMATIDQRAQSDAYRHDTDIHRSDNYLKETIVRELGDARATKQREQTYRSQNLQRTLSDAYRSYTSSSSGQKVAPRQSVPRPIFFPRPR